MSLKWTWLSGLASDLNVWDDELSIVDMEAEHVFVPFAEEASALENVYDLETVRDADVLVGTDISALAMLKSISKRPEKQRWILLAPILDACHGEDAWPETQILQMAKEVQRMPKAALGEVLELFGPADEDTQDLWMKTALKIKPELLGKGFEFLAKHRVESPMHVANCEVRFGKEDEWVTLPIVNSAKELLLDAKIVVRPKAGHWPISLIG